LYRAAANQSLHRMAALVAPVAEEEQTGLGGSKIQAPNLVASLSALVRGAGLKPGKLTVGLKSDHAGHIEIADRHSIPIFDRQRFATWRVPSLRELLRGNRQTPADVDHYPPEYSPQFYFIEEHFLTLCAGMGDGTDQEMEESLFYAAPSP
jgi:hypothetical protein